MITRVYLSTVVMVYLRLEWCISNTHLYYKTCNQIMQDQKSEDFNLAVIPIWYRAFKLITECYYQKSIKKKQLNILHHPD